ncbi:MAG: MBL fold metallo-hydrolase [Lachnospiraceae bacterium]|jgi:glyoxylase-like metal-dependent hydrolase (beta-lactamase superfamily II)|nr:MBL fold metallo-hydrolase [Lachnospiraceae bacterium]
MNGRINMILKRIKVKVNADLETNCYIVVDEKTKEGIVLDPAGNVNEILEILNNLQSMLKYILITHAHGDHIVATNELKQKTEAQVLIHRFDKEGLTNSSINLAEYIGLNNISVPDATIIDDNDILHVRRIRI